MTPGIDALKLDHPVNEGSSNVSDMEKWAKFVTVVPGQHGRFKMKIGSSPIYGGFSDVWECDAKFSDGMTIAVGVMASKQLSVSHCLYLLQHRDLGIEQVAVKKFRAVRIDRNADENTVNAKLLKVRCNLSFACLRNSSLIIDNTAPFQRIRDLDESEASQHYPFTRVCSIGGFVHNITLVLERECGELHQSTSRDR